MKRKSVMILATILVIEIAAAGVIKLWLDRQAVETPKDVLKKYVDCIEKQEYEKMYTMLETESAKEITQETFVERNSKIYEGMDCQDIKVTNVEQDKESGKEIKVSYNMSFDTLAGKVSFSNRTDFVKEEEGYRLVWKDSFILPDLGREDKVQILTTEASRGRITDRNGDVLAGPGTASSVGIIPGKLTGGEEDIKKAAKLLDMEAETIQKKLDAGWVKDDSFVPLTTLIKVSEKEFSSLEEEEELDKERKRQEQLLEIPGIMLTDTQVRTYQLKEAAAHLIGYVQNVTAEDLEEHKGEGYRSNSVIGKSGMEGLYEKELKGQDGHEILITDEEGETKKAVATKRKEDGKDIQLTIDSELQKELYEQFKEDKSCSAALNPYTGEVLAMVSTPSFDDNDFIRGMSGEQWTSLNEDNKKPLYNRFRQTWCPGSTFKPIIAAIGLKTGALDAKEDLGSEGLSWQKDESWGDYKVTTLHEANPANMKNAIIYSDNIYFAKAALKIGADNLQKELDALGFNEKIPFEISMGESQYSNTDGIEDEVQLADSGYGQGQILINPLHLASVYTSFLNDGSIMKPYLQYKEQAEPEVWIKGAFSKEAVQSVREGLKGVVNDSGGTGYAAHGGNTLLEGKTGTAEIKASKEDTSGTELGYFAVYTGEKEAKKPILLVSMAEDVKEIGGSGYVVRKAKKVLDEYLK